MRRDLREFLRGMTVGLCNCGFMVEAVKGSLENMVENTVAVGMGRRK